MKIGILLPQAEELPEDKKEAWNRLFLKTPRENMLPKPPFCTSGNCETVSFCCPKTPDVCFSVRATLGPNTEASARTGDVHPIHLLQVCLGFTLN